MVSRFILYLIDGSISFFSLHLPTGPTSFSPAIMPIGVATHLTVFLLCHLHFFYSRLLTTWYFTIVLWYWFICCHHISQTGGQWICFLHGSCFHVYVSKCLRCDTIWFRSVCASGNTIYSQLDWPIPSLPSSGCIGYIPLDTRQSRNRYSMLSSCFISTNYRTRQCLDLPHKFSSVTTLTSRRRC